jgi:hypothetical protein
MVLRDNTGQNQLGRKGHHLWAIVHHGHGTGFTRIHPRLTGSNGCPVAARMIHGSVSRRKPKASVAPDTNGGLTIPRCKGVVKSVNGFLHPLILYRAAGYTLCGSVLPYRPPKGGQWSDHRYGNRNSTVVMTGGMDARTYSG